jgi:PAS domain S-box-containing protein
MALNTRCVMVSERKPYSVALGFVSKQTDNEPRKVWNEVMKTRMFSAVHTAACRLEQSMIRCGDSTQADAGDKSIQSFVIPDRLLVKWQAMADTSAQLAGVSVALIMRVVDPNIQVLVSSHCADNPYNPGDSEPLEASGAYCERVVRTRERLLVPNALASTEWKDNPDTELGMISYLGLPLLWPNLRVFGTICVLDSKENPYSSLFELVFRQFKDVIEEHLATIYLGSGTDRRSSFEARRMDEALRISNDRLRFMIEGMTDEFLVHDDSGKILEINPQACLDMEFTLNQLLGSDIRELPVRFDDDWNPQLWARAQGGDTTTVRATRHDKRVGLRILEAHFSCQIIEGKKVFLGLVRDVTEQITSRKAVDACGNAKMDETQNGPPDNWRWDVATGQFSGAVDFLRIVGKDEKASTFSFEEFLENVYPGDRAYVRRIFREAVEGKSSLRCECRVVSRDGPLIYIECWGMPDDAAPAGDRFIGTFNEITLVQRAEDAISETYAVLSPAMRWAATGELAASVVHEVNQPLGVIANYAGAIKNWLDCPEPNLCEACDAASGLADAAMYAGEIVSGLKVVARTPSLRLSDVGVTAAAREILTFVRFEFEKRSVVLRTRLPADDVIFCCDRTLLQQAFLNLLRSALHSADSDTEPDCQVWFSCERAETGELIVTVAVNSSELNETDRGVMFDPLPMDRVGEMGTGLFVCRTIAGAHGGRLWAEPQTTGGVTFRFVLPGKKITS